MRHVVVLVAVFAVVLGIAVWSWPTDAPSRGPTAPASVAQVPPDVLGDVERSTPPAAWERERVAAEASAGLTRRVVLRVVREPGAQPIGGAQVFVRATAMADRSLTAAERELDDRDPDAFVRSQSERHVADAEGRVVLAPTEAVQWFAWHDESYGEGEWNERRAPSGSGPFSGEFVLVLQPDRDLHVLALDAAGQPAVGASIACRLLGGTDEDTDQRRFQLPRTNAAGRTRWVHAARHVGDPPASQGLLFAYGVGFEGVPVAFDPQSLPTAPLVVLVPSRGEVEVQLQDAEGRPWPLPERSSTYVLVSLSDRSGGMAASCDEHGVARFRSVALGQQLVARGPRGWPEQVPFRGPVVVGERVVVELRVAAHAVVLAGRLLAPDGVPSAVATELLVHFEEGAWGHTLELHADGSFRQPLPERCRGDLQLLWFRESPPNWRAVRTVRGAGPGTLALGDVVLGGSGEIATGRIEVVGEGSLHECRGLVQRWSDIAQGWVAALDAEVTIAADATFAVTALEARGRFRLEVATRAATSDPVEFVAGARDLRVSVASGVTVVVQALVDAVAAACYATLQRDDGVEPSVRGSTRDDERMTWQWSSCPPGAYRLRIELAGAEPWLDLAIQVPANGVVDDARLRDLDFRGRGRWLDVQVTDADGAPWRDAAFVAIDSRGGVRREHVHVEPASAGRLRLPVVGPVDVFASAPGFLSSREVAAVDRVQLRLVRAVRVTLDCADVRELPKGIAAGLGWDGLPGQPESTIARSSTGPRCEWHPELLDGRVPWTFDQGELRQPMLVLRRGEPPWEVLPLGPWSPERFVDGATLELHVEPAALQAALRRLAAK